MFKLQSLEAIESNEEGPHFSQIEMSASCLSPWNCGTSGEQAQF